MLYTVKVILNISGQDERQNTFWIAKILDMIKYLNFSSVPQLK